MNEHYWINKRERAIQAREHCEYIKQVYDEDTKYSIENSSIYDSLYKFTNKVNDINTQIIVDEIDSVNAIFKYNNNKTAVLNFASYKHPGGMFLQGSKAQEECLCHASNLYNVLKELEDYYNWNNQHLNKALYKDRAVYSKDIIFMNDNDICKCDVITCAAPNKAAAQKYCNIDNKHNYDILKQRINFVLKIANEQNVDTLILGAFGCGVFGQNPIEVASIFNHYLHDIKFNKVIFAIPGGDNYEAFKRIFN